MYVPVPFVRSPAKRLRPRVKRFQDEVVVVEDGGLVSGGVTESSADGASLSSSRTSSSSSTGHGTERDVDTSSVESGAEEDSSDMSVAPAAMTVRPDRPLEEVPSLKVLPDFTGTRTAAYPLTRRESSASSARLRRSLSRRRSSASWQHETNHSIWDALMELRRQLARARRHKGLRYFEKRYYEEIEAKEKEERRKTLLSRREDSFESARKGTDSFTANLARIREFQRARYGEESAARVRRHHGLKKYVELVTSWDAERREKRALIRDDSKQRAEAAAAEEKRAAKRAAEEAERVARAEDAMHVQSVMELLRRSGTLPSIYPKPPRELCVALETDRSITIRPKSGATLVVRPKKGPKGGGGFDDVERPPSYFNVDLYRFKAVERLRGEGLGHVGAVALARELSDNCIMNLQYLDLYGCDIGRLGMDALSEAILASPNRPLHTLALQANDLPGHAMKALCQAAHKGALQSLRVVNLKQNNLQDQGTCLLASAMLKGGFRNLEQLYLQSNDIGSTGVLAMYRAGQLKDKLLPAIQSIHLRQNRYTHDVFRHMHVTLPFLSL